MITGHGTCAAVFHSGCAMGPSALTSRHHSTEAAAISFTFWRWFTTVLRFSAATTSGGGGGWLVGVLTACRTEMQRERVCVCVRSQTLSSQRM